MQWCCEKAEGEDRYEILVDGEGQRLSHNYECTRRVNNEISSMCSPSKHVPQGSDERKEIEK